MNWHMTAAERVAQIRTAAAGAVASYRDKVAFHIKNQNAESLEAARRDLAHAEAEAKTLDSLSDLDVLNRAFEQQVQERIAIGDRLAVVYRTRDRDIHGSAEAYREQAVREFRNNVDGHARAAMGRWADSYLYGLLQAVAALPRRPEPDQITALKATADSTRTQLRAAADNPAKQWEPTDHETLVQRVRHHIHILSQRENPTAADVLHQIQADLDGESSEFGIPGVGTEPAPAPSPFVGEHWHDRRDYHVYEPPGGARVLACEGGDAWHVDLYGPDGRLLAYGDAIHTEVPVLAPALAARASEWATDLDGYAWKRFADVANELRQEADAA